MSATNNNATSSLANATDIRDIKPPVEIPGGWEWLWWVFGALVVVGLLLALLMYLLRRRNRVLPPPPMVPAHLRAKQKLQEALGLISQPKAFCIAVSDTIRHYLEERFEFHAPERTTEEFLYELQRTKLLTDNQKGSLGEFLQGCDLVKFAKYEPGEPELRDLHGSALRLVEETEPPATQTAPPSLDATRNTQRMVSDGQSPMTNGRERQGANAESEIVNRKS